MIKLSNVSKSFDDGKTCVVSDVSLEVHEGETLVLLGSSGCGKTTTLKMINRLIEPTSGDIEIDGQNIKSFDPVQLRRSIGYVFQGIGLFPHMTVEDNIAIVLRLQKKSLKERRARANELLEMVNLAPKTFAKRYPDELSGGQKQRVGVARAIASDPKYLLMDEPFGALDAINRAAMQEEMVELNKHIKKTIVFVTHDIFEAIRLGHRVAVMNKGRIEQLGDSSELINRPATDFVKSLFQTPRDQLNQFTEQLDGTQ